MGQCIVKDGPAITRYYLKVSGHHSRCRVVNFTPRKGTDWTPENAESNDSIPILFIHGLGCTSSSWVPTLNYLAANHPEMQAIAPDLPGCGESNGNPFVPHTIAQMREWVIKFLNKLQVKRVHLVGTSMGCQVSSSIAAHYPDRVCSLVLACPTPGNEIMTPVKYVYGILRDGTRESKRYTLLWTRMVVEMGIVNYICTSFVMMIMDNPVHHLQRTKCPVLTISGARDTIISEEVAKALADLAPKGSHVAVPDQAHAMQFDAPDIFVNTILPFIKKSTEEES